ncbi:SDR family oxidoreductase [Chryseobacterium sp.]|uniref:SDR family oxidoreductase n=1 Tax=Chryseobacterium sp. TaxID=1871047 RepID=UPI00289EDB92|nr:SDR family oxidoreductase [Chryseobacterium sp.]
MENQILNDKSLKGKTVVITGGSSGVGRAAAEAFALEGCNIVIAARGEKGLEETVTLLHDLGAVALAVKTDVSVAEDVQNLAEKALQYNGRIDIWVNNAGVMATGKFEDMSADAIDQVIKTNLLGYLHGAHTVLPIFKKQTDGILINNISIGGWVPTPYGTAYSASKYGIRGMVEGLQGEVSEFPNIHVCALYPGMQKSTGNSHSAKYSGLDFKVPPGASDPRDLAELMVKRAKNPKVHTLPDFSAFMMKNFYKVFPELFTNLSFGVVRMMMKPDKNKDTNGNIFVPSNGPAKIYGETALPKITKKTKLIAAGALAAGAIFLILNRKNKN